jgi:AcrR family transcriptional regulator
MRQLKPQRRDHSASVRGQTAVVEILSAARNVLIEEGYPRFTMRNIADRAGMTVGNLSYYYKNKEDLLHDLLEAVIQGYLGDFERIVDDASKPPDQRLEELVRFIMNDLSTKETTGFFPALWALANHDSFAAAEMEKMYAVERGAIARAVRQIRPDLSKRDRDAISLFLSAAMEGHTMFIGYERENKAIAPEVINIASYAFLSMVRTIDAKSIRQLKVAPRRPLKARQVA